MTDSFIYWIIFLSNLFVHDFLIHEFMLLFTLMDDYYLLLLFTPILIKSFFNSFSRRCIHLFLNIFTSLLIYLHIKHIIYLIPSFIHYFTNSFICSFLLSFFCSVDRSFIKFINFYIMLEFQTLFFWCYIDSSTHSKNEWMNEYKKVGELTNNCTLKKV